MASAYASDIWHHFCEVSSGTATAVVAAKIGDEGPGLLLVK